MCITKESVFWAKHRKMKAEDWGMEELEKAKKIVVELFITADFNTD